MTRRQIKKEKRWIRAGLRITLNYLRLIIHFTRIFFYGISSILIFSVFWFFLLSVMICSNFRSREENKKNNQKYINGLVSITIVNWNGKKYLKKCIGCIKMQTYKSIEIIISDNGSTDGSLEQIEKSHPDIKIIRNNTNLGFSKGHNIAIRKARGEYTLPLNFDVFMTENFVEELVKAINKDKNIGSVSGKLLLEDKKTIDSTGIIFHNMFPKDRGENEIDNGQFNSITHIFGPCGAAPLYKREMLEDIKYENEYFDEDFNLYVEDVDLAWRAQLSGWNSLYAPLAVAYHERGVTRKGNTERLKQYEIIGYRNRYLAIIKNLPLGVFWNNFKQIAKKEMMFIGSFTYANWRPYRFYSYIGTITLAGKFVKKRKYIQNKKRVGNRYISSLLFPKKR
ncbi:MAG: hypothetical protein A7315_07640 [Candidatus Altiarchaeales archaeon WOR_SM1_79]|nr:MAG: hypothetical protein A7315_07640 [Candidatus Altiarchaeales archaeon WOR_SM1_79]